MFFIVLFLSVFIFIFFQAKTFLASSHLPPHHLYTHVFAQMKNYQSLLSGEY